MGNYLFEKYQEKLCGCRHFELLVDPGKFGLTGVRIGG